MEKPAPASEATLPEGIKDSLPIVISYIPVAFAFGLNATRLGFTPLESLFFSCIIYAGASQFVITAMLAAGSSLWVAALTVMAMDVRHVLYGPSLRSRIHRALDKRKTALWAFGLTDEVFAAATAKLVRDNRRWSENWMLGIAFTSWISWVFGTLIGAYSGSGLLVGFPAVAALSFMLPALFMSFTGLVPAETVSQRDGRPGRRAGRHYSVFIPAAILAGIVCGCLTALIQASIQGMPDEQ
jgi:4-azaleucine resistance transporter AzlC